MGSLIGSRQAPLALGRKPYSFAPEGSALISLWIASNLGPIKIRRKAEPQSTWVILHPQLAWIGAEPTVEEI